MSEIQEPRQILAAYDSAGIYVYQAFNATIANEALARGTFGPHFSLARMTWIKPSFGWMLYRAGYGYKDEHQRRILKIKLTHPGFTTLLARALPSTYRPGEEFASQQEWQTALRHTDVRYQWDPDRTLRLHKLERRAIQLGLSGPTVKQYVHEWIIAIEDVTPLAHAIFAAHTQGQHTLPPVPVETVYPVSQELQKILRME